MSKRETLLTDEERMILTAVEKFFNLGILRVEINGDGTICVADENGRILSRSEEQVPKQYIDYSGMKNGRDV